MNLAAKTNEKLSALTDDELIVQTEREIRFERKSTLRIIKLFEEISDRKIYLERGFPSFYEMVTKHFGYCAGSAMRRINAMKLVKELPQFEEKIESGELSLSVAADVQSFLYQEAKIERPYSLKAKIELVETCLGKSRREVEEEFVRRNPEREKRESSYAISADRLRVSFSISKDLNEKLNQLKDLLSHVDPAMTTETLIERLAELGLDKFDPVRKAQRAQVRKEKQRVESEMRTESELSASAAEEHALAEREPELAEIEHELAADAKHNRFAVRTQKRTRYIPAAERHSVQEREGGCSYIDSRTGRRCGARGFLQLDHIRPYASGGANVAANLRWMCGAHNRWRVRP